MAKRKLDLHDVFNQGRRVEAELHRVLDAAEAERIPLVEIVHGKGKGQLKEKVLKFLERPEIKTRYHRIEKDSKNSGRLFVHFKHK